MVADVRWPVGKSGRPPKSAGDQGTKQVRVFEDLADMLSDLALVHPNSTAQILDPLIRIEVCDLHARFLPKIEEAKRAKVELEEKMARIKLESQQIESQQGQKKHKKPG